MAKLLKSDGTEQEVFPANKKFFTLKEMQKLVGGYIEMLRIPDNCHILVFNEEGKMQGLSYNQSATYLAILAGIADDDEVVGDALLVALEELDE